MPRNGAMRQKLPHTFKTANELKRYSNVCVCEHANNASICSVLLSRMCTTKMLHCTQQIPYLENGKKGGGLTCGFYRKGHLEIPSTNGRLKILSPFFRNDGYPIKSNLI